MILALLLAVLAASAEQPAAEPFPRDEIVPKVVCRAASDQSYALYLPSTYDGKKLWPILYLYDPRRRGPVAAERFRAAAEKYGWILASSNNTESDGPMAPNLVAIKALWHDTHERFSIAPRRTYAAGFSGGARAACLLAEKMEGEVPGVIACGGGFPDGAFPEKPISFAVFATVGTTDFNYLEMRQLDRALGKVNAAHRLAVFDGPHAWAPAPICEEAVAWLEVQAMKAGTRPRDVALIETLFRAASERAAGLEARGKLAEAYERASAAAEDFRGLADTKEVEARAARLGAVKEVTRPSGSSPRP